jgi:hypothetical protein
MMLKQIANTIAVDLSLVKFNLGELKKSIQLISLIILTTFGYIIYKKDSTKISSLALLSSISRKHSTRLVPVFTFA